MNFRWYRNKEFFLPKFFMNVHQNLRKRVNWSSRENRPIFNVKQSPEQVNPISPIFWCYSQWSFGDSEFQIFFVKNFHRHPLSPYLRSQLNLTAKTARFQGQTSLEQQSPHFVDFHTLQSMIFWTSGILDFLMKFFMNVY